MDKGGRIRKENVSNVLEFFQKRILELSHSTFFRILTNFIPTKIVRVTTLGIFVDTKDTCIRVQVYFYHD